MKRPSGLWILLSAGVLWLSVQDVYCVRATSLKFKSTTTTTTTTTTTSAPIPSEDEGVTTEVNSEGNVTKPTLTGNPQLDYVYDPNLPKELNGYNLADYPFYERVPADIDFKCDGLHDGFYASVVHKCQVYHHCLYGTRYDFLCANFTAFDQKTFICHFASEVDCNNSKKFWHRNDALYQAASTTTLMPIPTTPAPTPPPVIVQTSNPVAGSRRIVGRPYRRRRPQFDYYDDYYDDFYYEDRPRSRGRKRPRPRPRPLYDDDDYEQEYVEERYEKRGSGARRKEQRRPYNRRPGLRGRNKERVETDYEDEDQFEDEDKFKDERVKSGSRRKPTGPEESRTKNYPRRRPSDDRSEEDEDDDSVSRPSYAKNEQRNKQNTEARTIIKPVSGTVYDRPRLAPRIKLPVPKNEAKKYEYKPLSSTENSSKEVLEYNDDYEVVDDPPNAKKNKPLDGDRINTSKNNRKQVNVASRVVSRKPADKTVNSETQLQTSRKKTIFDDYEDYEYEDDQSKIYTKNERVRPTSSIIKAPASTTATTTTTTSTTSTTSTTTMAPIEKMEQPLIRLVKRPFLPSRGGNPYLPRGLQPVGARVSPKARGDSGYFENQEENINKPQTYSDEASSVGIDLSKSSVKTTFLPSDAVENFQAESDPRQNYMAQVVSVQAQKYTAKNPLDIDVNEYDVTLNDALNPTLPNLPVRGYPSGFDIRNDYTFGSFLRPSYSSDQAVATASTGYSFKSKPPDQRQRYDVPPQAAPSDDIYSNVYHHCLNGQRYDFLCANYTAFDQTLFNCNFVSNVDCVNSKKFWSRNDELYKTLSTTAPPIVYNFYTTAPPAYMLTPSPVQQLPPAVYAPLPAQTPIVQRRPVIQRRPQPLPPKRTQQFEYYDEEYEEQPRMVYRRKRPRPRPVYYDDDYDYYDEGYHRTAAGRRRRPYGKRPMRKNQSRRVQYDDDDEDDYRLDGDDGRFDMGGRFVDDEKAPGRTDRGNRKETNRREMFDKRRTTAKPYKKRRMDDEYEDEYEDTVDTKRSKQDESPRSQGEPKRIQKVNMRRQLSSSADYEDEAEETPQVRKNNDRNGNLRKQEGNRAIIKPTTGTLYDRPRVAPRINLPVPKNAAEKFAYKSVNSESLESDSEEYDARESLENSSESTTTTSTTDSSSDKASQRRANYLKRNGNRTEPPNRNINNDDSEIQERRADRKQAPVIVKSPLQPKEDLECTKLNNCSKEELLTIQKSIRAKPQKPGKPRVSVFKTPINSQRFHTPDLEETEKLDILNGSLDESINEAY